MKILDDISTIQKVTGESKLQQYFLGICLNTSILVFPDGDIPMHERQGEFTSWDVSFTLVFLSCH